MKALLIGAARSGIALSKLLNQYHYEVYLTDINEVKEKANLEKLGIKVFDKGHPDFLKELDYALVVKNPGIKYQNDFVKAFIKKGYHLLNELEVALSFARNYEYAAVTGTNGKTTTVSILAKLLQTLDERNGAYGNIGYPLSDLVLKYPKEHLKLAIELSSFQALGLESFRPKCSVITNLSPDHIDYHNTLEAYYKAKTLIYQNQAEDDWFLLNIDDNEVLNTVKDINCQIVTYSINQEADLCLKNNKVVLFEEELFDLNDLKLVGKHNLYNAMVASAMAYKMGVKLTDIKKVIRQFNGIKHRLEFIQEVKGVKYYNDSKGTNPDSTKVALSAFDNNVILIAGGYDKGTGFEEIIPYLSHVKAMCVYGETKDKLKAIYEEAYVFNDLKEATLYASNIATKGDVVLLSPMCASWDQFENFEIRGEYFETIVKQL